MEHRGTIILLTGLGILLLLLGVVATTVTPSLSDSVCGGSDSSVSDTFGSAAGWAGVGGVVGVGVDRSSSSCRVVSSSSISSATSSSISSSTVDSSSSSIDCAGGAEGGGVCCWKGQRHSSGFLQIRNCSLQNSPTFHNLLRAFSLSLAVSLSHNSPRPNRLSKAFVKQQVFSFFLCLT